jgi:hypothetical protein
VHRLRTLAVGLASVGLGAVLTGCGASEAVDSRDEPDSVPASTGGSPTAQQSVSPSDGTVVPGDGTYEVGSEVQPGVYVATGGDECHYQRLGDLDRAYDQVIVRGLLDRPVIEIMAGDGGFRTEGCGSWTPIERYAGPAGTEMPGDGIWLVGEDVVPGTYEAEGGEWCLWQRLDAFAPELDSVIQGGSNRRATVESGDVAFVTEGCGAWTRVG